MKAYVKPDYEVVQFTPDAYVCACVTFDTSSVAGGWCQVTDGWYMDMNGTAAGADDEKIWMEHYEECNGSTVEGESGAVNYIVNAKDLVNIQAGGLSYWANAYVGEQQKDANQLQGSDLWVKFLFNSKWHAMNSSNLNGLINQNQTSITNRS